MGIGTVAIRCLGVMAAALLAACAAPPPLLPLMSPLEIAGRYGYSERDLAPGRIEVSFLTPAQPTGFDEARRNADAERIRALAQDLAMWRAAELSLGRGSPAFEVVDSRVDVQFDIREQSYYPPYYGAGYPPFYPPLIDARRRAIYPWAYDDLPVLYRTNEVQARAVLVLRLLDRPTPGARDAKALALQLRAKYSPVYEGLREGAPGN